MTDELIERVAGDIKKSLFENTEPVIDWDKPIQLRDGTSAKFLSVMHDDCYNVAVFEYDCWGIWIFGEDGRSTGNTSKDIINVTESKGDSDD